MPAGCATCESSVSVFFILNGTSVIISAQLLSSDDGCRQCHAAQHFTSIITEFVWAEIYKIKITSTQTKAIKGAERRNSNELVRKAGFTKAKCLLFIPANVAVLINIQAKQSHKTRSDDIRTS